MPMPLQTFRPAALFASSRNRILRNTYWLLALSMLPVLLGGLLGGQADFSASLPHTLLLLGLTFGLIRGVQLNRSSGLGIALMLGFAFMAGLLRALLHLANGGQLIAFAAAGMGCIFLSLAALATLAHKHFSFAGNVVLMGMLLAIFAGLGNQFVHLPALMLLMSSLAMLALCVLLLFDVGRIVNDGETSYICAVLGTCLDMFNLFVHRPAPWSR